jgi:2-alkyl-3-oxoalkanoate reductase
VHILITGASGVLGRALVPHLQAAGHIFDRPSQHELDLFDANAVSAAVAGCDAVVHLASRIPARERMSDRSAWRDNDGLRSTTSRLLVDALLQESGAEVYVVPTVTMLYQTSPADEGTPIGDVPAHLRSAIVAEQQAHRATDNGTRGIILRLGRLYGPGTEAQVPDPTANATLHIADAGAALHHALSAPAGTYNVCDDGGAVSNDRLKAATEWRPRAGRPIRER